MSKASRKKSEQLGMPFGTANGRLKSDIIFSLIQRCNLDICLKCEQRIINSSELSVEHLEDWLDSSDPVKVFFDLDNIGFSHKRCNKRRPTNIKYRTEEDKRLAKVMGQKKWRDTNPETNKKRRKDKYIRNGT